MVFKVVSLSINIKVMENELLKRIAIIPGLMGGRPTIRAMRFKAADVLGYLAAGITEEEWLQDFTYLQKDDIKACDLYAPKKLDYTITQVNYNAACSPRILH